MSTASLTFLQTRFEIRNFLRNRSSMLFSLAFPILFLVIFGSTDSGTTTFDGREVRVLQFFVPGIIAFGIISTCYTSLAIRLVLLRDNGVLKRVKGTPLPRLSYLGGHLGASVTLGLVLSAVTYIVGYLAYDVSIPARTVPAALLALVVGSATMCAIGLAVSSLIPNGDGAPGIINFLMFPILFVSDVFYSTGDANKYIGYVGAFFPLKHFANSLQAAFNPVGNSLGFSWVNLGIMALWGVVATVIAVRRFSWESKQKA